MRASKWGCMKVSHRVAFASLFPLVFVTQASAVPLPQLTPASFFLTTVDTVTSSPPNDHKDITGFGTYTASSGSGGTTATATATLSGGLDPALTAQASAKNSGPNTGATADVKSGFSYEFRVTGPTANVNLTISATGLLTSTAMPDPNNFFGSAQLFLGVSGPGPGLLDSVTCTVGTSACSQGFAGGTVSFQTGAIYTVQLGATLHAGLFSSPAAQSLLIAAFIDPSFSVAAGTLNANQYTFEYSPGLLSNVAATPLPAAMPLFAGGLGVLGLFARRRKQKQPAA
jgi:hypothetical protein